MEPIEELRKKRFQFLHRLYEKTGGDIYAEEIYLKNGDRISGKIIEKTETKTVIETQALGTILINNSFIKEEEKTKAETVKKEGEAQWIV